jgi:transcriptional regulator with XRE-family HTH domain
VTDRPLGDFLHGTRARVRPEDAGLPAGPRRRVPGLRREEVALLAGVSVDYYVRLEQGRERNPSPQVLNALATVLRLDDDARSHLFRLAGLTPRPTWATQPSPERADPDLRQLLDSWPDNPALILGRAYDVLAGNQLGYALFEEFRGGANLLVKLFLDPDAHSFYQDWDTAAVNTVAGFRLLYGQDPHHPRVREVLESMLEHSPQFAELWRRNEARGKQAEVKTFHHHDVGDLTLRMHAFDVRAAPGQQLIVYHAEPGTASADALTLLGTLTATTNR